MEKGGGWGLENGCVREVGVREDAKEKERGRKRNEEEREEGGGRKKRRGQCL